MQIQRSVTTDAPVEHVFAYLSDFTTTTEWDPACVSTTRAEGDGGAGTVYDHVSRFAGRETALTYEVVEYVPCERVVLRGENDTVVALDTMAFERTRAGGTKVTYIADFSFKGLVRLVAPLLSPAITRLGDDAERGMSQALSRL